MRKQADATSKETAFSGLPKACKLRRNAAHAIVAGVWTYVQWDTVDFNYGGFTPILGIPAAGIKVNEPGAYSMFVRMSIGGPANEYYLSLDVNGVNISYATHPNTGVAPRWMNHDVLELKAGDVVGASIFAGTNNTGINAGEPVLYVEKKGGQY